MKARSNLPFSIFCICIAILLLGSCAGRKKGKEIADTISPNAEYYYYTLVGNRVRDKDPGNFLTVLYSEKKNKRKVKRALRKQDLKVVEAGIIKEEVGPYFYLVEGKNLALNRYREDRLATLKQNELISSVGFLLNFNFVTDKYASYSGKLEIQFTGESTEARLRRILEKLHIEVNSVEQGNNWNTLMATCPPDAGTFKINELIEKISESDISLKVSPEYDGVFSTVILE